MRFLLALIISTLFGYANDTYKNMKNCETINLSKFTVLISCHNMDYLVEYKKVDDEDKDNIKKITVITVNNQNIIKTIVGK